MNFRLDCGRGSGSSCSESLSQVPGTGSESLDEKSDPASCSVRKALLVRLDSVRRESSQTSTQISETSRCVKVTNAVWDIKACNPSSHIQVPKTTRQVQVPECVEDGPWLGSGSGRSPDLTGDGLRLHKFLIEAIQRRWRLRYLSNFNAPLLIPWILKLNLALSSTKPQLQFSILRSGFVEVKNKCTTISAYIA
jgi:hypothetical protein